MTKITVPTGETGVTRVFALSMPASEARSLREDTAAQQRALGADQLEARGVEVFAVGDLGEMGLTGYLREGVDVQEDQLKRDAARLSAIDGWVMLVYSSAFSSEAATLDPAPALTLIGTYGQTRPDSAQVDLQAEAAKPYTGTPDANPQAAPARGRGQSMIIFAIVVLLALALYWLLG